MRKFKFFNPVIIVSSGAIAFGKSQCCDLNHLEDEIIKKRVLAGIGNPLLSVLWNKAIKNKTLLQSLITHRDLTAKDSQKKIIEIISSIYIKNNLIIQVNDNDFITDEELTKIRCGNFGDNDKLTALLANLCKNIFTKIEIIFNTNSDGVLEGKKVINLLKTKNLLNKDIEKICNIEKSNLGTGGMLNKLKIIRDIINKHQDIEIFIINGKKPNQLKLVLDKKQTGTKIIYK